VRERERERERERDETENIFLARAGSYFSVNTHLEFDVVTDSSLAFSDVAPHVR